MTKQDGSDPAADRQPDGPLWETRLHQFRQTPSPHEIAWLMLSSFMATFIVARIMVFLIMSHAVPDFYLHMGETHVHVHHLNYGIFMLSVVGAWLLIRRPEGWVLKFVSVLYGIGLGLTFDEFGMWLHLGGLYWQRSSFDAVVVVGLALSLLAVGPSLRRWRQHHLYTSIALGILFLIFAYYLHKSMDHARQLIGPWLENLETNGPS